MTCRDIIFWCVFIVSLNIVPMQFESIAPSEGSVGPLNATTSEGESRNLSSVHLQELQPKALDELTRLFNDTNQTKITKEPSVTVIYTDLPMLEGGGKPIEKEVHFDVPSSPSPVEVKTTAQSSIEPSTPNFGLSTVQKKTGTNEEVTKASLISEITVPNSTTAIVNQSQKIYSRKGVSFDIGNSTHIPPPQEMLSPLPKINKFIKSSNENSTIMKPIISALPNSSISISAKVDNTNTSDSKDNIISNIPLRRKKPLTTTDLTTDAIESAVIKNRTPGQRDKYVIPVVVTILTVPMIVVLGLYFYKKSHECWERRHYRRMDFLIDGIYND